MRLWLHSSLNLWQILESSVWYPTEAHGHLLCCCISCYICPSTTFYWYAWTQHSEQLAKDCCGLRITGRVSRSLLASWQLCRLPHIEPNWLNLMGNPEQVFWAEEMISVTHSWPEKIGLISSQGSKCFEFLGFSWKPKYVKCNFSMELWEWINFSMICNYFGKGLY